MDPTVAAAVITGAVAVAVAAWTAIWTSRMNKHLTRISVESAEKVKEIEGRAALALEQYKSDRAREAAQDDRRTHAKAALDELRQPLMAAAYDLNSRIHNIRSKDFLLHYVGGGHVRADLALKTTLFRFSRYFGWVMLLERQVTHLRFETQEDTKAVALLLHNITACLSTDGLDVDDDGDARLMLWREEQQAVGGLMQHGGPSPSLIGYETFVERYDVDFAPWLDKFGTDLQRRATRGSERLRRLQRLLGELVGQLDEEGFYAVSSPWIQESNQQSHGRDVRNSSR